MALFLEIQQFVEIFVPIVPVQSKISDFFVEWKTPSVSLLCFNSMSYIRSQELSSVNQTEKYH